jgi:hypothetical protein
MGILLPDAGFARALEAPAWWVAAIYAVWNAYHFAAQNFGVLQIYRHRIGIDMGPRQRLIDQSFCCSVQAIVSFRFLLYLAMGGAAGPIEYLMRMGVAIAAIFMLLREASLTGRCVSPRILVALSHVLGLVMVPVVWMMAINGANHWLTAIGLCSHVDGQRRNVTPLIFAASVIAAGIILYWSLMWNGAWSWNLRDMIRVTAVIFCIRAGIGFWHFLQDRWLWKFSEPEVRATIGKELFT